MATIGVRDLYVAKVTQTGFSPETYGTPRRLAKAIKIEMTTEVAEGVLYADDGVDVTIKEFVSGEIKINANDIADADEVELLGAEQDDDNVSYGGGDDNAPYWAVGFRAKKPSGQFTYVWLFKVKFAIPDETYDTKADGITFNTPTLVGTFIQRDSDGRWRAKVTALPTDTVATTWFASVREFVPTT
jgi:phi13 family phage major tail protein